MLFGAPAVSNTRLYNEHVHLVAESASVSVALIQNFGLLGLLSVFFSEYVDYAREGKHAPEMVRTSDWIRLELTRPNPWVGNPEDYQNGQV